MGWRTSEVPLPGVEIHHCDKQGCPALARIHFLSVKDGASERREARRCDVHAEELRAQIEKRPMPVAPAPKPVQQAIDPVAELLEPKTLPQAKRAPRVYATPTDRTPSVCSTCAAAIFFIKTDAGVTMPVEAFGPDKGTSHFIHCQQADQHRRRA